jgi:hypothetical protein
MSVRFALVVRALIGVWFAWRIATAGASWLSASEALSAYLRLDGAMALVVAGFFLRESARRGAHREAVLALVLFIDGAGRSLAGLSTHVWPGLLEFPVTLVVFLAFMALCTAAVGISESTLVVEEEVARHGRWHRRPQFSAWPIGLASVASIAFGVAAIATMGNIDVTRQLLVGHLASVSVVMLSLAATARKSSSAATQSP